METSGEEGAKVFLMRCQGRGGKQEWRHNRESGQLIHAASGMCLDVANLKNKDHITVQKCSGSPTQVWKFEQYVL